MTAMLENDVAIEDLFFEIAQTEAFKDLLRHTREEDLSDRGDITSALFIGDDVWGKAHIRARHAGIIAGLGLMPSVVHAYSEELDLRVLKQDGDLVYPDEVIGTIEGPVRRMLEVERVLLNFLSHLSGIASKTKLYVDEVAGTNAKIYDTRKTIPGYRDLAKAAVVCGGGYSHRMGLYDAMLIKDNHIALARGEYGETLKAAVNQARALSPEPKFIEVEVDRLDQLQVALHCDVDLVLLDNMSNDMMRAAVAMRDDMAPKIELEASGGIMFDRLYEVAETGVDRIAVGALTHTVTALDIGLDAM